MENSNSYSGSYYESISLVSHLRDERLVVSPLTNTEVVYQGVSWSLCPFLAELAGTSASLFGERQLVRNCIVVFTGKGVL